MVPWIVLSLLMLSAKAQQEKDLVTNLPGLQFETNFKTYSGYLKANVDNTWHMHYMLTESKHDPDTDPLLVWFNGGPGCSSYAGLFEELGPFYVNFDGQTLYENKYSWNAKANVLYLESPIGVGYSYDSIEDSFYAADDSQTASQNYFALQDFFINAQPKYQNRTFFLSGESYAGIYIPMLSQLLVQGINAGTFPNKNFQGAAIGNGFMNVKYLLNSLVLWSAYHGRVSIDDWNYIKANCTNGETDMDKADFTRFMVTKGNGIDFNGDNSTCGQLLDPLITMPNQMFPYNYYQDCYDSALIESPAHPPPQSRAEFQGTSDITKNTATLVNYISTDDQWGYPCWNEVALMTYSNRRDVQDALHIPDAWRNQANGTFSWTDCNDKIYNNYHITFNTTNVFFDYVLKNVKTPNFRFLIYNGDVDTVCNYLGDSWHMKDVAQAAKLMSSPRQSWYFSRNNQVAGFYQRYSGLSGAGADVTIDVLTVKGAGHMVPFDRPGPSVQMITNFMFPGKDGVNYSSTANTNPDPSLSKFLGSVATDRLYCLPFIMFVLRILN
ncbi:Carboxypeptidase [Trichostrongylus colubriformis]|uniref:Carboxypeptidase n=1 Tax=Trichostrongylus colubriformis TaxID=6319 RepID=A0AAN8F6B0_TRICO